MEPHEQLEQWLESKHDRVRRNVQVVTPLELETDHVLHISTNTQVRAWIPLIGRRQAPSEDRTVPRITCATTLLGCFIGYGQSDDDFRILHSNGMKEQESYKGGYKIYSFPFDAALKPNNRLVYDANQSGEVWLTSFSAETTEYKPEMAGKVFYRSLTMVSRTGMNPRGEMELCVDVMREGGLQFSKSHFLAKGCWMITGPVQRNIRGFFDDKEYTVRPLTREEYTSYKRAAADLLSLEALPAHQRW